MTLQTDSISRYTSNSPFHPLDVVIAWLEITLALSKETILACVFFNGERGAPGYLELLLACLS